MNFSKDRYTYNFPCPIRFGAGVIDEIAPHLKALGLKRPFIVTDPGLVNLPFLQEILQQLSSSSLAPKVFSQIAKNPVKANVLAGAQEFKKIAADCIIGLGGGASMDVARAIALAIHHHRDLFDYDDALGGDRFITAEIPYFITVPTTSGTGSEVGRSSVISEDLGHQKRILFSPRLMARQVFADPALTLKLPAAITAAVGMDALTHNIEAYFSKGFSPLCDGIALEGIRLTHEALLAATYHPNIENRSKMMMAALMGATAFQKGLGVVHSTAHPLSTIYDTHHGLANAVMLPYGVRFNADTVAEQIKRICKVLDLQELSSNAFIDYLIDLNTKLKMPASLQEMQLDEQSIDRLAALALKDGCHLNNPKAVALADFKLIYQKAFRGEI